MEKRFNKAWDGNWDVNVYRDVDWDVDGDGDIEGDVDGDVELNCDVQSGNEKKKESKLTGKSILPTFLNFSVATLWLLLLCIFWQCFKVCLASNWEVLQYSVKTSA